MNVNKRNYKNLKIKDINSINIVGNPVQTVRLNFGNSRNVFSFLNIANAYPIYEYASKLILGQNPEYTFEELMKKY